MSESHFRFVLKTRTFFIFGPEASYNSFIVLFGLFLSRSLGKSLKKTVPRRFFLFSLLEGSGGHAVYF